MFENWFNQKAKFEGIVRKYRDDDLEIYAGGQDAISMASIKAFEEQVGFAFPRDFRNFSCSPVGGVYIAVKEAIWPRPKLLDVAPLWTFLYGFFVYGFGKGLPEWMDIRLATPKFREITKSEYVPCLKLLGQPDVYCFDKSAKIHLWHRKANEMTPVEKSFTEIFTQELIELKDRKERKKSETKL